jgi:G2/mitotic-specific cyclin 3/4
MLPNRLEIESMQVEMGFEWEWRSKVIEWLFKLTESLNDTSTVVFLAANYFDRFLSRRPVNKDNYYLTVLTALSIAMKFEARQSVPHRDLVKLCEGRHTVEHFRIAELEVLDRLHFDLGWPGPLEFLKRYAVSDIPTNSTLAEYILENSLLRDRLIGKPPSLTAAAAYCLARCINSQDWASPPFPAVSFNTNTLSRRPST